MGNNTINDLMENLEEGKCELQSTKGSSTIFVPVLYDILKDKWWGWTRNGSNNVYIAFSSRVGSKKMWYIIRENRSKLQKTHKVSKQLYMKSIELGLI